MPYISYPVIITIFLLLLIIFLTYSNYNSIKECFVNTYPDDSPKKDYIFISIASYRDELCPKTLISLYENAKNPEKVIVGICQQNDENDDADCFFPKTHKLYNKIKNNIKTIRISSKHAKGPTYARWLCSALWYGEEFYLQIDSHTTFEKKWDKTIIDDIRSYNNNKICITYYPPDIT